ncbi:hypothetical protein HZB00_04035 [Candidatus Woesearchaeota archaeon]|nr:hypothetical protein [Candidatus Woesearchaeota archaeon]
MNPRKRGDSFKELFSKYQSIVLPTPDALALRGMSEFALYPHSGKKVPSRLFVLPNSFLEFLAQHHRNLERLPGFSSELAHALPSDITTTLRLLKEANLKKNEITPFDFQFISPTISLIYLWDDRSSDRPERAIQQFYERCKKEGVSLDKLLVHSCLPEMQVSLRYSYGIDDSSLLPNLVDYEGLDVEKDRDEGIILLDDPERVSSLNHKIETIESSHQQEEEHPKVFNVLSGQAVYEAIRDLHPRGFNIRYNQFLVLKDKEKEQIYRCVHPSEQGIKEYPEKKCFIEVTLEREKKLREIWPRSGERKLNLHQRIALEVLYDPSIKLVFINGLSGSGKTTLALSAAIHSILTHSSSYEGASLLGATHTDHYRRVLQEFAFLEPAEDLFLSQKERKHATDSLTVVRPNGDLVHNLGLYLPRYEPFRIDHLSRIQGVPFDHRLTIIDEVQDTYPSNLEEVIGRRGKQGKVIFLANPKPELWKPGLDVHWNGFAIAVARYKTRQTAAVLHLPTSFYGGV